MRYSLMALAGFLTLNSTCDRRWPWQKKEATVNYVIVDRRELDAQINEALFLESCQKIGKDSEVAQQFGKVAAAYEGWEFPSSARFHNLGNARLLADQLPEAILAFQRGLRLDPGDAGLRANLDYARAKVQYPFGNRGRPEVETWPPWLFRPSRFQVVVVALGAWGLAWALATRWYMTRRRVLVRRALAAFILAAVCGFYWLHLDNERAHEDQHPLVVIRDDKLTLRKGNGPSYPANPELPVLARGMEARRLHERGGWLQIQFASGDVGWIEKAAVLIDEP